MESKKLKLVVLLLDTQTDEMKLHTIEEELVDGKVVNLYKWTKGNFECDCTRGQFFDPNKDHNCGQDRYFIQIIHPASRTLVYSEFNTLPEESQV